MHARGILEWLANVNRLARLLERHVAIVQRVLVDMAHPADLGHDRAEHPVVGVAGVAVLVTEQVVACVASGELGATTVGGTLAAARLAGIRFMGTGGIGGVHRGFADRPDVSADLAQLTRTPALVVYSGIKSLLDVTATAELLETLGVPVLGFRTDELPLFYTAGGGPPVPARVESAEEAASVAQMHWQLKRRSGLLLAQAPPTSLDDVEPLIEQALAAAEEQGVSGPAVTPFVLSYLHEHSGGRTREVNRELVLANAQLAAEVAVAYSAS